MDMRQQVQAATALGTVTGEHGSYGGRQLFLTHESAEIGLPMRFALYVPPGGAKGLLVFLVGLTATEETFTMKAGAQRLASELGLALLMPDTSARGDAVTSIPGATASWDFGVAAGFYLDATQTPWATHWRMESYLMRELIPRVQGALGLDAARTGISGHSMGGHGALTLALRHPGAFASLSALAPITAPSRCPWGEKAFTGYLGEDRDAWPAHDASALMQASKAAPYPQGILVDQGLADKFLDQLHPEAFESACASVSQPLTLRRHEDYDHGYYFIATVIDDHLAFHARRLIG
ncbi:S-formylglutathione hydrolase [Roseateles chitosanitabidus]|uniref:S-formylglutathione hydrolase n=1 Tax=Roseateles chitosanitabidus TaxID=65048 RepID=UPI000B2D351F